MQLANPPGRRPPSPKQQQPTRCPRLVAPQFYRLRCIAYSCLSAYDQALNDAERVIELQPKQVDGWYHKGFALYHLRDYQGAVRWPAPFFELCFCETGACWGGILKGCLVGVVIGGFGEGAPKGLRCSLAGERGSTRPHSVHLRGPSLTPSRLPSAPPPIPPPCAAPAHPQAHAFQAALRICPSDMVLRQGFWDSMTLMSQARGPGAAAGGTL